VERVEDQPLPLVVAAAAPGEGASGAGALPTAAVESGAARLPGASSHAGVVSAAAFQAARGGTRAMRSLPLVQRAAAHDRARTQERAGTLTYAAQAGGAGVHAGAVSTLAAAAPAMVQREPLPPESVDAGSGFADASPAPEVAPVALPPAPEPADVAAIARQVYEILVRRLVSERRQRGW
jgi:hypothetical protein